MVCVRASPAPLASGDPDASPRAAGCTFNVKCDSTGEERVPIPCDGFCDKYFFCKNGNPVLKKCGRNLIGMQTYFNNYNRQCESGFTDCDWWKDDKTTPGPDPTDPNPTDAPEPTKPSTAPPPEGTTAGPTEPATTAPTTTVGPCIYNADCDATGTQKKPIPCAGFCNRYYLCVEGVPTVKTCDTFENFNNVTRECSITFKDCDWYKAFEPTTPAPQKPPTPAPDGPTQAPTTTKPNTTTQKSNGVSPQVLSTVTLLLAVWIPLLALYF